MHWRPSRCLSRGELAFCESINPRGLEFCCGSFKNDVQENGNTTLKLVCNAWAQPGKLREPLDQISTALDICRLPARKAKPVSWKQLWSLTAPVVTVLLPSSEEFPPLKLSISHQLLTNICVFAVCYLFSWNQCKNTVLNGPQLSELTWNCVKGFWRDTGWT